MKDEPGRITRRGWYYGSAMFAVAYLLLAGIVSVVLGSVGYLLGSVGFLLVIGCTTALVYRMRQGRRRRV
jgi:Flp pilus assembly protein TadB